MCDRESGQFGIGSTFVVAKDITRIVAGANTDAADAQSHFFGAKQLVQQFSSRRLRHLTQHIAGCVGKSCAKSQNGLRFFCGIDYNCGAGRSTRRGRPAQWRRLRMMAVGVSNEHRNLRLRCRHIGNRRSGGGELAGDEGASCGSGGVFEELPTGGHKKEILQAGRPPG